MTLKELRHLIACQLIANKHNDDELIIMSVDMLDMNAQEKKENGLISARYCAYYDASYFTKYEPARFVAIPAELEGVLLKHLSYL